jgi:hypothetical protein
VLAMWVRKKDFSGEAALGAASKRTVPDTNSGASKAAAAMATFAKPGGNSVGGSSLSYARWGAWRITAIWYRGVPSEPFMSKLWEVVSL